MLIIEQVKLYSRTFLSYVFYLSSIPQPVYIYGHTKNLSVILKPKNVKLHLIIVLAITLKLWRRVTLDTGYHYTVFSCNTFRSFTGVILDSYQCTVTIFVRQLLCAFKPSTVSIYTTGSVVLN